MAVAISMEAVLSSRRPRPHQANTSAFQKIVFTAHYREGTRSDRVRVTGSSEVPPEVLPIVPATADERLGRRELTTII